MGKWNHDYVKFLIEQVWEIDKPVQVLDCGCGFGFLGMLMMPFLPKGSMYTGIDLSEKLLALGKKLFSETDYDVHFIHKDVYDYHATEKYDLVICQAVLRHLDTPDAFLKKMIEFARKDAWIICIDSNREFECDGLYVDGMDYFSLCKHDGLEKHWRTELKQQGRDYAAAIRNAHRMRKLGLKDVDVRMNDRVDFVSSQREDYEQAKQDFVEYNDWNAGLSAEEKEKAIQFLMTHEMSRKDYLKNYLTLDEQFISFAEEYSQRLNFCLLSNDVLEWSEFLTEYHHLNPFFKEKIVSGEVHIRKPDRQIFVYALDRLGCEPEECIFIDNSVKNLLEAGELGMQVILFNRDGEKYDGKVVNDFVELGRMLENM